MTYFGAEIGLKPVSLDQGNKNIISYDDYTCALWLLPARWGVVCPEEPLWLPSTPLVSAGLAHTNQAEAQQMYTYIRWV